MLGEAKSLHPLGRVHVTFSSRVSLRQLRSQERQSGGDERQIRPKRLREIL